MTDKKLSGDELYDRITRRQPKTTPTPRPETDKTKTRGSDLYDRFKGNLGTNAANTQNGTHR